MTRKDITKDDLIRLVKEGWNTKKIGDYYGVDMKYISARIINYGLDYSKLRFNHDFFETIDTEEKAYWLGYILGDGNVSNKSFRVAITSKDLEHLDKWHKSLNSVNKYYIDKSGCGISSHISRKMVKDLAKLNIFPKKSLTGKFPTNISNLLLKHVIRGLLDSDGSVFINNRNDIGVQFLGTWDVVFKVKNFFKLKNKICNNNITPEIFHITVSGNYKVFSILDLLYDEASIFLERKKKIYDDRKEYLSTLKDYRNKKFLAFNEEKTLIQWSKDSRCVVKYSALRKRINLGMNPEVAITTKSKRGK